VTPIVPHLWYDTEARQAAEFYASVFPDSAVGSVVPLPGTPSGDAELVEARILGQRFLMISAGPLFRFTPAISFQAALSSVDEVNRVTAALAEGGRFLMELGTYPFARRYAWVQDRWGLSWQILVRDDVPQGITPVLMFSGDQTGRCEEACRFYVDQFGGSLGGILRYPEGPGPDRPGTVQRLEFTLGGQKFAAMDSGHRYEAGFNQAVSLLVEVTHQKDVDRLWAALSAAPEAEACGWCQDPFGVSWQISPAATHRYLTQGTEAQKASFLKVMLTQKKFDLEALEAAWQGG